MKVFVILSLLVVAVAVQASVIPDGQAEISERSIGSFFKHIGDKIKETYHKVVDKVKSLYHKVVGKAEDFGKKVGHFVSKSEKVVGDFFVKEGKVISHAIVVGGQAIEHVGQDVFDEVKKEFKKVASEIDFHQIILELVNRIDTDKTEAACAKLSEEAIVYVAGQKAADKVKSFDPFFKSLCKAALHVVEMIASKELKKH